MLILKNVKPGRVKGIAKKESDKSFGDIKAVEVRDVSFGYGKNQVLKNYSDIYENGEIYFLTTPSGEGKTTRLKILAGLLKPDKGEIAPKGITASMLFQEDRLLPYITAYENILLTSPSEKSEEIKNAVRDLIQGEDGKKAEELSGGMKRRVALLRALFHESDILLLDEPYSALDEDNVNKVKEYIRRYKNNRPVIIATHIGDN